MAKALKCDRCGKYYDKNRTCIEYKGKKIHLEGMAFANGGGYYTMHKDLCDECIDQLVEFFDTVGEPVEDGPDEE